MIPNIPPDGWEPSPRWTHSDDGRSMHLHGIAWSASVWVDVWDVPWLTIRGCGTDATDWLRTEVGGEYRPVRVRLAQYRGEALVRLLDAGTIAEVRR